MGEDVKPKSKRGFASMTPEQRKRIAKLGGVTAHANGTRHKFTHEEAVAAGRKGGLAVSKNREHMSTIGKAGGRAGGMKIQKESE